MSKLMRLALEEAALAVALEELAEVYEGGCVAFDLDGTMAQYDGWKGEDHIGAPVEAMIKRVKQYLERGTKVVIFTARAADKEPDHPAIKLIEEWSVNAVGQVLPITNEKTPDIVRIYDDRARQVIENKGTVVGEE